MTTIDQRDERRLEIPVEIGSDPAAIELISVWFSQGKVKIMTRSGTGLDSNSGVWGEILAGIASNIALCTRDETGVDESTTLEAIHASLEKAWPET